MLLKFWRSSAQVAKAVKLMAIGKRRVKGFVPGRKIGLKGVIYGVSLKYFKEELVRELESVKVAEAAWSLRMEDSMTLLLWC